MPRIRNLLKQNHKIGKKSMGVVALLTDFGLHDQYVASMKGVILSINPAAQVVDITHEVQPQRVREAGYLLWSAYKFFPEGTIFVVIVDPGVGGERRIIGVKTKRFVFLAPDNGLLDFILNDEKVIVGVEVSEKNMKEYVLREKSWTFHGRDIFAPLAGHLSRGLSLKRVGVSMTPQVVAPPFILSQTNAVNPCILHIDHFGNIITNLALKSFEQGTEELKSISIGRNIISRWTRFYNEAPENTPCLVVGSSGLVEISVKNKSAMHFLNATLDTPVKVYWR